MKTETSKFKEGDTIKCIKSFFNPELQKTVEEGYIVKNMTQFGIDCLSHPENWIKVETTREQAIDWWKKLKYDSPEHLEYYAKKYFKKNWDSLTAKEVEEIWLKETTDLEEIAESMYKPNQKQFKQFDESLFKAYIDKFSDKDKLKMLKVVFFSQPKKASIDFIELIVEYTTE